MKREARRTNDFERWLPVRFVFKKTESSVIWVNFGEEEPGEPFFNQQVKKLQRKRRSTRKTTVAQFLEIAGMFQPASPNGYICHVTRSGSTLLANAIREAGQCVVLSEAQPLYQILNRPDFPGCFFQDADLIPNRRILANALVSLYSALFGKPVAIKGHTIDILRIDRLRAIWPDMPILVNTRCPVEVLVSNLNKPGDWVRSILAPLGKRTLLGIATSEFRQMSIEEYCARAFGDMCRSVMKHMDDKCRLIEYTSVNAEAVQRALDFFRLDSDGTHTGDLVRIFAAYSKNPQRAYVADGTAKQHDATESLRRQISAYAQDPYDSLSSCRQLMDRRSINGEVAP
jgi:hypothetical protein